MGASIVNDDDMGHSDRATLWVPLLVWLQPHLVLLDRGGASFLALIAVICHVIRWRSKPTHFSSPEQRLENFLFFPGQLVVLTEYSTGPFNQVAKQQLEWNQESQESCEGRYCPSTFIGHHQQPSDGGHPWQPKHHLLCPLECGHHFSCLFSRLFRCLILLLS